MLAFSKVPANKADDWPNYCRIAKTTPFVNLCSHTSPLSSCHNLLLGNHDTIADVQPIVACYTFCIGFRMFVQYSCILYMTNFTGERGE